MATDPNEKPNVQHIDLDKIVPPSGDADARDDSRRNIPAMMESLATRGQLTPIMVYPIAGKPGQYELGAGHRRYLAAKELGWQTIRAEIHAACDRTKLEADRLTENFDREDLSVFEKARGITRLLDVVEEEGACLTEDLRLERVAQLLGRQAEDIREFAYIARLSKKTRDLVLAGRLPFQHAALLARVADPSRRDQLAERFAAREDGSNLSELSNVRQAVEAERFALKQAPWQLDVAFAGEPACSECPFNTANDRHLFGDGEEEPPRCTKRICFEKKRRSVEASIERAIPKIKEKYEQSRGQPGEVTLTPLGLETASLMPKAVKPTTLSRRAKQIIEPVKSNGKAKKSKGGGDGGGWNLEREAQLALEKTARQVEDANEAALAGWLDASAQNWAMLVVALAGSAAGNVFGWTFKGYKWNDPDEKKAQAMAGDKMFSRAMELVRNDDLAGLIDHVYGSLDRPHSDGKPLARYQQGQMLEYLFEDVSQVRAVVLALRLDAPPLIDREAFIKQYKAEHAATAKAQTSETKPRKKKRSKKTTPGVCRGCGFTDHASYDDAPTTPWADETRTLCNDCAGASPTGKTSPTRKKRTKNAAAAAKS